MGDDRNIRNGDADPIDQATDAARDDLGMDDDGRLPWLETAEDYPEESGSRGKVAAMAVGGIIVLIAAVALVWWLVNRGGLAPQSGEGELIAAQEGDYKVRPEDPMGKQFEGEGDEAFAASEGRDASDNAATAAASTAPSTADRRDGGLTAGLDRPAAAGGSADRLAARPAAPAATPAAAPSRGGSAAFVQLGAYSDSAKADAGWTSLTRRFDWLGGYAKDIAQAQVDGRTVYRLRAGATSADEAVKLCARIKAAGESCIVAR